MCEEENATSDEEKEDGFSISVVGSKELSFVGLKIEHIKSVIGLHPQTAASVGLAMIEAAIDIEKESITLMVSKELLDTLKLGPKEGSDIKLDFACGIVDGCVHVRVSGDEWTKMSTKEALDAAAVLRLKAEQAMEEQQDDN